MFNQFFSSSALLDAVFCSVAASFDYSHWASKWPLLFIIIAVVIVFDIFVVVMVFNKKNPNWMKSKKAKATKTSEKPS